MMFVSPKLAVEIVVASLSLISAPARADGRAELDSCKAMIDRAAQPAQDTAAPKPDDAALARCRQIVRDWTLRDSRMTVDEQGRPLR
jgi:hypothetical protein